MINSIHRFFDKVALIFDDATGRDLEAIATVVVPALLIAAFLVNKLNGEWRFWGM